MSNEEKYYGVRISFDFGNPITIELKGAGRAYIIPGKDYFFENAPIEFINYLAQLKGFGVSYKITTDKKGCYNTFDLKKYNVTPRVDLLRNYRMPSTLEKPEEPEVVEPVKEVKVTQEDIVKIESVPVEPEVKDTLPVDQPENTTEEILPEPIKEEPEVNTELPTDQTGEEITQVVEEPHVYTEEELKSFTKSELLAIASDLNLEVSDINTKKEIREAILNN